MLGCALLGLACGRGRSDPSATQLADRLSSLTNLSRMAEAQRDLLAAGPAAVKPIEAILSENDTPNRVALIAVLSAIPDPLVANLLSTELKHRDPNVRRQALHGLAMQPNVENVEPILRLTRSKQASDREWAFYAVERLNLASPVSLHEALTDEDPFVKTQALRVALRNKDSRALEAASSLAKAADGNPKSEALIALCSLAPSDTRVKPFIGDLATQAKSSGPGRLVAIQKLGSTRAPLAEDSLIALLGDPDPQIRMAAAGSIGSLDKIRNPQTLVQRFKTDPSAFCRRSIARAIAKLHSAIAAYDLAAAVRAEDRETARLAAMALADMADTTPVQVLVPLLQSRDKVVQRFIAIALAKRAVGRTMPQCFEIIDGILRQSHGSTAAKLETIPFLSRMSAPAAVARLRDLSADPDRSVRLTAMAGLKRQLRMPQGIPSMSAHPPASWQLESDL